MINKTQVFDTAAAAATTTHSIPASDVIRTIGKHMLVDVLDFIVDLKRSEGSYIYDANTGKTAKLRLDRGEIALDGVAFGYEGRPLLDGLTLALAGGRMTALAGEKRAERAVGSTWLVPA